MDFVSDYAAPCQCASKHRQGTNSQLTDVRLKRLIYAAGIHHHLQGFQLSQPLLLCLESSMRFCQITLKEDYLGCCRWVFRLCENRHTYNLVSCAFSSQKGVTNKQCILECGCAWFIAVFSLSCMHVTYQCCLQVQLLRLPAQLPMLPARHHAQPAKPADDQHRQSLLLMCHWV